MKRDVKIKIFGCIEFLAVFLAAALRFLYFGFEYYPLLDDYVQYHNYPTSLDYGLLIKQEGLLASRPLAGISDLYVWAYFWDNMIDAVIIISAMWAASAILFKKVFDRRFGCGYIFLVIYALLPLGFEGTYWVSASSRVVCGMFFTALSAAIFDKILNVDLKKLHGALLVPAFVILQLISFCFYEQILVLSFAVTILLSLHSLILGNKKAFFGLFSVMNAVIYFVFTGLNASGNLVSRMEIILPNTNYYFDVFLKELLRQLKTVFINGNYYTIVKGFLRGAEIINEGKMIVSTVIILSVGIVWYICARVKETLAEVENAERSDKKEHKLIYGLVFSIVAAGVPLLPFFIITNPWFSFRGAVPSFCGIALFADIVANQAIRKISGFAKSSSGKFRLRTYMVSGLTACLTVVFMVSAVSELADYKAVHEKDTAVVMALLELYENDPELSVLNDSNELGDVRIGVFNLGANMLEDQNYYYHEHVCGVTENPWSLLGMTFALREGENLPELPQTVPLDIDETHKDAAGRIIYFAQWNSDMKRVSGFDYLYWYDNEQNTLIRVFANPNAENSVTITDGINIFAEINENPDNTAYIELFD